jgi:hypothetical protein
MKTWTIIADAESAAWREQIARRFPLVSPHKIARLAMRYGLRSAVLDPSILIEEAAGEPAPEKKAVQP